MDKMIIIQTLTMARWHIVVKKSEATNKPKTKTTAKQKSKTNKQTKTNNNNKKKIGKKQKRRRGPGGYKGNN